MHNKNLANRLKASLIDIISPNQTAFVPSKSIAENVLRAQEIEKNYYREKGHGRCTIRVDL